MTDIKDYLGSEDFKSVMPYLLSGGGGALAGAYLSGRRRKDSGETKGSHMLRVLRNSLLAGGLAAGGHALLNKGFNDTVGSVDEINPVSGRPGSDGPLPSTIRNIAFNPLTAGAAGIAGLGLTDKMQFFGANRPKMEQALEALSSKGAGSTAALRFADAAEGLRLDNKGLKYLRQTAGIPSGTGVRGALSTIGRRGLSTFGQSAPRQVGRGALGLLFAGLPAIAGSFLTEPSGE